MKSIISFIFLSVIFINSCAQENMKYNKLSEEEKSTYTKNQELVEALMGANTVRTYKGE